MIRPLFFEGLDDRAKMSFRDFESLADLARVEVAPEEMERAFDPEMAEKISAAIKPLGFRWVSLDLEGYRMGSLNEVLFIRNDD